MFPGRPPPVALALLTLSACATFKPQTNFVLVGEADPGREAGYRRAFDQRGPTPPAAYPEIKVMIDSLPPGLLLRDGVLSVKPGAPYRVISKVQFTTRTVPGLLAAMSFPDYSDAWRKGYCYPQAVLTYLTLMIWALAVPLDYPCYGTPDPRLSKERLIAELKSMANLVGGNLVIASYDGVRADDPGEAVGAEGFVVEELLADLQIRGMSLSRRGPAPRASPAALGFGAR